jgi:chemotaxis protein histidine kinase CheA
VVNEAGRARASAEFIDSTANLLIESSRLIEATPDKQLQVIDVLFRNMHTIKGNARTYGPTPRPEISVTRSAVENPDSKMSCAAAVADSSVGCAGTRLPDA